MHLTAGGICRDVLHQLDDTVRKQQYNDDLDHKVLELLGLRKDIVVTPNEFLEIVENNLLVLVPVCTHPKEDVAGKRMGIEKGIEILRRRMGSKGERENLKTDN
jgi:hypothetical protein